MKYRGSVACTAVYKKENQTFFIILSYLNHNNYSVRNKIRSETHVARMHIAFRGNFLVLHR